MHFKNIKFILTDIEGTTTSVRFVYDELFPYFRANMHKLEEMKDRADVQAAFKATVLLAHKLENKRLRSTSEILETLNRWSLEDRKVTPLKTVQGIIWEEGYRSGEIKGHVYPEVPEMLAHWKEEKLEMGVFSSGSVAAQKLIFGFSELGDLTPYFGHYFDTETGGKREVETYQKIAAALQLKNHEILFLSDIKEELVAAREAGMQTCQLLRPGTEKEWDFAVENFKEIQVNQTV